MTLEFYAGNFDFGEHNVPKHVEYTTERLEEVRAGVNVDPSKYQVHRQDRLNGTSEPFASEIDDIETAEDVLR